MRKCYCYVDAENVNVKDLNEVYDCLFTADRIVMGKFYGNRDVLGEITEVCFGYGFEYVDTSLMSLGRKNVTDMKIVVDCIADVLLDAEVDRVVLLSRDHDFIPLIHKMRGFGVEIVTPLMSAEEVHATCADVNRYLETSLFSAYQGLYIFEKPFDVIMRATDKTFSEELIAAYVDKKKNKILRALEISFGSGDCDILRDCLPKDFCFKAFWDVAREHYGESRITEFLDLFASKVYGVRFPNDIAIKKIAEWEECYGCR